MRSPRSVSVTLVSGLLILAAVSVASAGRITTMLGVARRVASCSTGWWVGPSSPTQTLSCVKIQSVCRWASAAMRSGGVGVRDQKRLARDLYASELLLQSREREAFITGRRSAAGDPRVPSP